MVYKSAPLVKDNYIHFGKKLALEIKSNYVADVGGDAQASAVATQLGGKSTFSFVKPGNEHFTGVVRYGDNIGLRNLLSQKYLITKDSVVYTNSASLKSDGTLTLVNPEIKGDRAFVSKDGKVAFKCVAKGGGFYVTKVATGKLTCLPVKALTDNQIFSAKLVA